MLLNFICFNLFVFLKLNPSHLLCEKSRDQDLAAHSPYMETALLSQMLYFF